MTALYKKSFLKDLSLFDLIQNSFSGRGVIHVVFLEKSIESLEKLVEWEVLKKDRKKWKKKEKDYLDC